MKLEVLAGASGLDRSVSYTHVSELDDPSAWLDGGELLMTNGLGLPEDAEGQTSYLAGLHQRHAAAVAIGVRNPPLTTNLLELADRLEFPILRVPREVPFLAIAHLVADLNQDAAQRRLVTHVRILDTLRLKAERGYTIARLIMELEAISGYHLAVISARNRSTIFRGAAPIDIALPDELPDSGHFLIPEGFGLALPVRGRLAGYLIALESNDAEPAGLQALQHIATVMALEIAVIHQARESQRRSGAEILAELLGGRMNGSTAAERLGEFGFASTGSFELAALRGVGEQQLDDEGLNHALCDAFTPHVMLKQQSELLLLFEAGDELIGQIMLQASARAGVSTPFTDLSALSLARREAVWSLVMGADHEQPIAHFGQRDQMIQWLPSSRTELDLLIARRLGPIQAYDDEHNTALMISLGAYFRHERRLTVAAGELGIHKHTLAYRLKRIEEVTGRNLDRIQDLAELWIALKALPLVRDDVAGLGLFSEPTD
ncbi:PucR family transcriptional regulator [Mycolicibacterium sp. YH-1]|uniref:PucR family transcriptional regulator n=1 Tax=Mycolicibacterium sp. YH-1 TaxID=2908837 RepID=UPI001F4C3670|nr:PucR family transcriptional regulator [Mycolicibacterium sp. YH-1]UNB53138.1 PucR family transcriptional regulator [Mycolicibacterium sp. YH-1]